MLPLLIKVSYKNIEEGGR